jgi:hypothetical protein
MNLLCKRDIARNNGTSKNTFLGSGTAIPLLHQCWWSGVLFDGCFVIVVTLLVLLLNAEKVRFKTQWGGG